MTISIPLKLLITIFYIAMTIEGVRHVVTSIN